MTQLDTLKAARGTLEPLHDIDFHGKWRIQQAVRLLDQLIAEQDRMPDTVPDCRTAFEEWAKADGSYGLSRRGVDYYWHDTKAAWEGWQGAWGHKQQSGPQTCSCCQATHGYHYLHCNYGGPSQLVKATESRVCCPRCWNYYDNCDCTSEEIIAAKKGSSSGSPATASYLEDICTLANEMKCECEPFVNPRTGGSVSFLCARCDIIHHAQSALNKINASEIRDTEASSPLKCDSASSRLAGEPLGLPDGGHSPAPVMGEDKAVKSSTAREESGTAPEAAGLEPECDRPSPANYKPLQTATGGYGNAETSLLSEMRHEPIVDTLQSPKVSNSTGLEPTNQQPDETPPIVTHSIGLLDELRQELETQYQPDVLSSWPWANLYTVIHNLRLHGGPICKN